MKIITFQIIRLICTSIRNFFFKSHRTLWIGLFLFLFAQCTFGPKRAGRVTDLGVWQGKVFFSNKKTKEKKWTYLTWASDSNQKRIRIDLYTIFYIPIATFLKKDKKNHVWIFDKKKYYFSRKASNVFEHFIQVPLNPNLFFKLLSQPDLDPHWKCKKKSKGITKCLSKKNKIHIWIQHSDQDQRIIKIKKGSQILRLNLQREAIKVTDDNFKLLPTDEYETVPL